MVVGYLANIGLRCTPLFLGNGKENSLSGDRKVEWWLGLTTPDQCG